MPRLNRYVVQVLRFDEWVESMNFEHRVNGPRFKSRIAAQRGLKKYGSENLRKKKLYRIVTERKPKKL